jgi:hypothetical protein
MTKFVEFDGNVHLVVCEHTLCGVAFDAADSESDESLRWTATHKRFVDCDLCRLTVEACSGVQTRASTGSARLKHS